MSTQGGRRLRAFRPSHLADGESEEAMTMRLENLEKYIKRASQGLPIFEEAAVPVGTERKFSLLQ